MYEAGEFVFDVVLLRGVEGDDAYALRAQGGILEPLDDFRDERVALLAVALAPAPLVDAVDIDERHLAAELVGRGEC